MTADYTVAYHGTDSQFDVFTLDYAVRDGRAENGRLGVWLAVEKCVASRFGDYLLTVQVNPLLVYAMPVEELSSLHAQSRKHPDGAAHFYAGVRDRLIGQGYDTIHIVELSGQVGLLVAMVPERLRIVGRTVT